MEDLRRARPGKIAIHVVEQQAHLWEPDDVAFIRREHHICGLMTGTLPAVQQQNVFLGLPQQLFPEEVVYLMRAGVAYIVDDSSAHTASSSEQRKRHWVDYAADAEAQRVETMDSALKKEKEFEAKLTQLAAKGKGDSTTSTKSDGMDDRQTLAARKAMEKRQRRDEAKRLAEEQIRINGEGDQIPLSTSKREDPEAAEDPLEKSKRSALALGHSHHTPGTSASSPWYIPASPTIDEARPISVYDTLSSALKGGVWHYPRTSAERSRCSVFEDLQSRGFYMGVGLRFGGDFVVYPGDPMRYHSHFTASVQTSPHQAISALELVGAGRLGTAVKKAHLLCGSSLDESPTSGDVTRRGERDSKDTSSWGHVHYYSLTWAGFGT